MTGSERREPSAGKLSPEDRSRPGLTELESLLSGSAAPELKRDVERCLRDSSSPLAQLVDLLGSHELIPAGLFGEETSPGEATAARAPTRRRESTPAINARRASSSNSQRVNRRWTTAGGFTVMAAAALAVAIFWRPPSAAQAGVERQLRVSQSQLEAASMQLDQEDYHEAELAAIHLRSSLEGIPAVTREQIARRRRLAIRAWTLESISLGQRGSFAAAEASLEQARKLWLDDRSDRLSAASLAYALGKVAFQKSQWKDIDSATRERHLGTSERHLIEALGLVMGQNAWVAEPRANGSPLRNERLRERLESYVAGTPVDERLAIRIVITLATTIHKAATPSSGQRDRELALWLYGHADKLLERHAPAAADLTWDLLHVQLAERRGLTLSSQARFAEALAGYEAAIRRLENRPDTDAVKLDYPLGILNSNRADVLAAIGDLPKEIEARDAALRHLERFVLARPTTSGFVNVRLNRARRAIARFARGEAFAAIDDTIAFFAITPAFANDNQLAQLTPFESARLYLIAAWHKARTNASADAELHWAARQLAADTMLDGLSVDKRQSTLAPYLRLAELETYPAYRAIRDRRSTAPSQSDGAAGLPHGSVE